MTSGFRFIVMTPPGLTDSTLAIAASRAGEIGVLDLQYSEDAETGLKAIARLERFARGGFGVKLGANAAGMLEALSSSRPDGARLVVFADGSAGLDRLIVAAREMGLTTVVEATSLEEALAAEEAGCDIVIAKGHEAAGRVGEEGSFVLLQRLLARLSLPVWVQGGIGLRSAAACRVAGAAGVVLDSQALLTKESTIAESVKTKIGDMDGSETVCLGATIGEMYRMYSRPGATAVSELRDIEIDLATSELPQDEKLARWRGAVGERIGWRSAERDALFLGQDACFAAPLARRYLTVGGIIEAMWDAVEDCLRAGRELCPLDEGSPLAKSHGTRFPIVQGPMTRVTDRAEFALSVADNGALPFLALALMRGPQVRELLEETRDKLGDRPWGVGILGFVPQELRQEQLAEIHACRPPFALIAGGRPDQARSLEEEGTATYLHVPSPGLLKLFLNEGARRFVFEGRECGGHVGPRCSFVLWETMIEALLEWCEQGGDPSACHVLFAGGIHDALSASMVATMAAPLAECGVRVGVLLGTAYLYTEEAVATGAITAGYQRESIGCRNTVLLETGPGHSTRVAETPYAQTFQERKHELLRAGMPAEEIRNTLEELNIGRLRVATKGVDRNPAFGQGVDAPEFVTLSEDEQRRQGTYMIGQVAALHEDVYRLEDLHSNVSVESSHRLRALPLQAGRGRAEREVEPSAIAIVGMGCILPGAPDLKTFWHNILNKVDAIREVPPERWDADAYYDPDPKAKDKVYSKWGGFLDDVAFDPVAWGIPPRALKSIEPMQLLALVVARAALEDAGYWERPFERERTSVVLGAGGGAGDVAVGYVARSMLPKLFGDASADIADGAGEGLPEWTEDSFAGLLMNVAAGRVANRLDLGGTNCTIDAACASSLAAIHLAAKELESHDADMVIAGGLDGLQNPFAYLCFSKTEALSPSGRCRPYDAGADGIAIAEGFAAVVLKRLDDAERDGDRVYAVIRGVGTSSDGRSLGLTAPRPEGQMRALERAYGRAGVSPAEVGLIEGHGTGTVAGDQAEVMALTQFMEAAQAAPRSSALGSVKSMIGHTKCTAGVAGLIKAALSLHYKTLPPTLNVATPNLNGRSTEGPLYVNSEARPWIGREGKPRHAGVSAFGFGGTNFHVVLEEYGGDYLDESGSALEEWPTELFTWRAESREKLVESLRELEAALTRDAQPRMRDLSHAVWLEAAIRPSDSPACLAIVASALDDLKEKLARARELLSQSTETKIEDPRGIYYTETRFGPDAAIAFLFPGQGSQYVNMLRELAVLFPEVRETFEQADGVLEGRLPKALSAYVFPPPAFSEDEEKTQQKELTAANVAQPGMGAADLAVMRLLKRLGVEPQMTAGHSYGEFVALYAADALSEDDLFSLSEARGRFFVEEAPEDPGTMAAIEATPEGVQALIEQVDGYTVIANMNSPRQTVVSGTHAAISQVLERCKANEIRAKQLPVACGYHSELVARAEGRLAEMLATTPFHTARMPVYSNTTAGDYPDEPDAIRALLTSQLANPVQWTEQVRAMHEAGARVFIEAGPRGALTGLAAEILKDRPHLALAADRPGRSALIQIQHLLAQLAAHGILVDLTRFYRDREIRGLNLKALVDDTAPKPLPAGTWLVNCGGARPASEPVRIATPVNVKVLREGEQVVAGPAAATGMAVPSQQQAAPALPATGDAASQVMLQYQQLMSRFLETQKNVMMAFLQGTAGEPAEMPQIEAAVPQVAPQPQPAVPETATPEPVPVAEPSVAEPDAEPVAPEAALGKEALTERLVAIVSERTGYPPDILDPDADLEADLGIDSIKRVEIVGSLKQSLNGHGESDVDAEELAAAKTLRAIVDLIYANGDSAGPAPAPVVRAPLEQGGTALPFAPAEARARRFTLRVREAPAIDASAELPVGSVVLITDDEGGVGTALAKQLREAGLKPVLVRQGAAPSSENDDIIADLTSPEGIAGMLAAARQRGAVRGLVHLLPLREVAPDDLATRCAEETKSLFLLAKALAGDFAPSDGEPRPFFAAATRMGGAFASDGASEGLSPTQGGVPGFLKTLAIEWPHVRTKAIDLATVEATEALAGHLMDEIRCDDEQTEVGYRTGRRLMIEAVAAPLGDGTPAQLAIDSSCVILLIGGARGITAEIARELAERYQPTLLLAGRTPEPGDEPPDTADLTAPAELKAALTERLRREGGKVTPALVEQAYQGLMNAREIKDNLSSLAAAGSQVGYFQVDVRGEAALTKLIEEIYQTYGRLDGVVHGAGVIEDKLIADKTVESFDRVLGTKTESAFALARLLKPESLKFLVFFSSVTARFGNRGQSDYGAANEVLNKLALQLDARWPARVVAMNWGPWKTGMVSPEVQRQFAERGIELIEPSDGRLRMMEELSYGAKGAVEVLIGGGWPSAEADESDLSHTTALPLLAGLNGTSVAADGRRELAYLLDPARDIYLRDHVLDGKPVLPLAMAMELMAEAAHAASPGLHVVAVRDVKMLHGIVVENGPVPLVVLTGERETEYGKQVDAAIASEAKPSQPYYQATIELSRSHFAAPPFEPVKLNGSDRGPLDVDEAYRDVLFHGPLFQGIKRIDKLSDEGASALLAASEPRACIAGANEDAWLADPVVIDSSVQLQLIWGRLNWGITGLPSRIARLSRFAPLDGPEIRCEIRLRPEAANPVVFADHYLYGPDGRLLAVMEGVELVGSKALNRVANGRAKGG